jgi:hypothetical protein
MASGYTQAGVDLDSMFLQRVNPKIADIGYRVAGGDITNRYEPRGTSAAIAATGYRVGGSDIANLFRNINYPVGTHGIVAGGNASFIGFVNGVIGNCSPTTRAGAVLVGIADSQTQDHFVFEAAGAALAQTWITSVQINGTTYTAASAAFFGHTATTTWWNWIGRAGLVSGAAYAVYIF